MIIVHRNITFDNRSKYVYSTVMLVFIPSLGAFVTPAILGAGKSLMIGNVISNQFLAAHDWPFGAALSTLMMALMLFGTLVYFRSTSQKGAIL